MAAETINYAKLEQGKGFGEEQKAELQKLKSQEEIKAQKKEDLTKLRAYILSDVKKESLKQLRKIDNAKITKIIEYINESEVKTTDGILIKDVLKRRIGPRDFTKDAYYKAYLGVALAQALTMICCNQEETLKNVLPKFHMSKALDGDYGLNTFTALKEVVGPDFNGLLDVDTLTALYERAQGSAPIKPEKPAEKPAENDLGITPVKKDKAPEKPEEKKEIEKQKEEKKEIEKKEIEKKEEKKEIEKKPEPQPNTENDLGIVPKKKKTEPETKPEIKPETKPEIKPETKPEIKPETKPEITPEAPKKPLTMEELKERRIGLHYALTRSGVENDTQLKEVLEIASKKDPTLEDAEILNHLSAFLNEKMKNVLGKGLANLKTELSKYYPSDRVTLKKADDNALKTKAIGEAKNQAEIIKSKTVEKNPQPSPDKNLQQSSVEEKPTEKDLGPDKGKTTELGKTSQEKLKNIHNLLDEKLNNNVSKLYGNITEIIKTKIFDAWGVDVNNPDFKKLGDFEQELIDMNKKAMDVDTYIGDLLRGPSKKTSEKKAEPKEVLLETKQAAAQSQEVKKESKEVSAQIEDYFEPASDWTDFLLPRIKSENKGNRMPKDRARNRTDEGRNKDSEKFMEDYLKEGSIVIDIGSALGNKDPKYAGIVAQELYQNPQILKQTHSNIIATDLNDRSNKQTWESYKENKRAYDIKTEWISKEEGFMTPVKRIVDTYAPSSSQVVLRAANAIDMLMTPEEAFAHFKHIAESMKDKEVLYMFNKYILHKDPNDTHFQVIGELHEAAFDHKGHAWKNNPKRISYTLYTKGQEILASKENNE